MARRQLYPSLGDGSGLPIDPTVFDVRWRHFQPQLTFEQQQLGFQQHLLHDAGNVQVCSVISNTETFYEYLSCLLAISLFYLQAGLPTPNNAPPPKYNYLVRIINPEQRSKFVNKIWHDVHGKFEYVSGLKSKLVADHEDKLPPVGDLECGYIFS